MNCVAEPTTPTMPKSKNMAIAPEAPLKPKARSRVLHAIPFQLEEVESVADLFTGEVEPRNEWIDPADILEHTFYKDNKIFKLYTDGTWDYVGINVDE